LNLRTTPLGGSLLASRSLVLGAAAAIGLSLLVSGAGDGIDQSLKDIRAGLRSGPASGEIHVIEIDARSLAEIDRWPWPRGVNAAAIDRLSAGGARSIAFDVDFSARSTPAEDAKLEAALVRAGKSVILPTFRQYAGAGNSDYIDAVPAKPFSDNAFLAAVNVVPDPDGYVRQMPLGVETAGTPRPSLASMVAESQAQIGRFFEIDYALDPASIPRHSMVDLIAGRIPASQIRGKRFVIGATAVEMGDRYAVPRHGVIPGVIIQTLAAETIMKGPVPERWSGLWTLLLALAAVAAGAGPRQGRRNAVMLGLGMAGVLAMPLLTEALFAVTLPGVPALAALLAASLLALAATAARRYDEKSLSDAATALPNLAALERAVGSMDQATIVVARIDRFAAIASGLGPAATTNLVLRVADRLRFADAERQVFRIDEAALAWIEAPGAEGAGAEGASARIDAVAAIMRTPVDCGRLVDVSLAFGIASGAGAAAKQVAANASLAAVHAADKGLRLEVYASDGSEETSWHLSLLGELDQAMNSGHLWNAYQPKLDLRTGRVIAAEALVRWEHPVRGAIQPDSFIPLVEAHGRARDLTVHVLEQALEDALVWEAGGFPLGVAVNVSANLLADHEFIEMVGQILQRSRLATSRVTIEVTETAAMDSPERAIAALESWRALGVGISIDDYGTGQSSLGYLQKLPATELKIDKSFILEIGADPRNAIMVRSTIALAHELGMKVVAEGIEDQAVLQLLSDMGCDTGQGYHIARPMSAHALLDFLNDRSLEAAA
jgi:EAL domain-containing protein (putative c-di-GMP-specific phosphodiesterase class I)/CHASE2 domain-containing sensor protein